MSRCVRGRSSKPALVLDIDETSLSNLPEELADDFGYIPNGSCDHLPDGPCGFTAWVLSGRAKAFDGTLALFNAAKTHHVAVFFITGRHESAAMRDATEKNLKAAGYDGWAGLVLRPARTDNLTVDAYKSRNARASPRRASPSSPMSAISRAISTAVLPSAPTSCRIRFILFRERYCPRLAALAKRRAFSAARRLRCSPLTSCVAT